MVLTIFFFQMAEPATVPAQNEVWTLNRLITGVHLALISYGTYISVNGSSRKVLALWELFLVGYMGAISKGIVIYWCISLITKTFKEVRETTVNFFCFFVFIFCCISQLNKKPFDVNTFDNFVQDFVVFLGEIFFFTVFPCFF